MNDWQGVWRRLRGGEHVVSWTPGPLPPLNPAGLRLIVLDCEAFSEPGGALDEARRRIDQMFVGRNHPIVDAATSRLRAGLRRHLLGEAPQSVDTARYLDSFYRVPKEGEPRVALLLRSVDKADPVSLELLTRLFSDKRNPHVPLMLSFDDKEPTGPARRLLEKLEHVLPRDAFFWEVTPAEAAARASNFPAPQVLSDLPAFTLRVLRAAATVGDRFESEVLAELLGVGELDVLAALQEAVDHGLAIQDRGEGLFRFEAGLAKALRERTLPSLARAWHERLAQLFGGPPAPGYRPRADSAVATEESPAAPLVGVAQAKGAKQVGYEASKNDPIAEPPNEAAVPLNASSATSPVTNLGESSAALPDSRAWFDVAPSQSREPVDPRREAWWQHLEADLQAARAQARTSTGNSGVSGASAPPPAAGAEPPSRMARAASEQRSAMHAEAAGLWDTACERHLAAAERASRIGSHPSALEHAGRALALAEQIDDLDGRRRVEMMGRLIIGRARWQCQGPSAEFSLQAALEPLLECRALITDSDSPELRAELASLTANVQYDVGTPQALEQALKELTLASQLLLDNGQPLDAARLLNDEAAVWVKLGDPVRANYLLSRSREVFGRVAGSYPAARVELAETEHLLARLLLQAAARPGRERDALQLGIEHGHAAEEAYRDLNEPQKLGRVWETLGRLELKLGHLDKAARLLDEARQLQLQHGDGVGLARSSAALSDVLVGGRNYPLALERLAESIALNSEKGVRTGLELNLASLRRLDGQLPIALHDAARGLERLLHHALGGDARGLAHE